MQYAVALLGLSVAPAIINALIIIIGELSPMYVSIRHAWILALLSQLAWTNYTEVQGPLQ